MKKFAVIAAVLFLLSVFAGCTPFFVLPTETIKAPRTTGEFEEIQKALIKTVGGDIKMKYPKVEGTSAAFTSGDVDGDGEGEILAFYQPDGATSTHINILKHTIGGWTSVADISPVGSNLESVELSDLDGDGRLDILTGWSVYDSKNYELAIFSDKNGQITRRTSEKFTEYITGDLDRDGTEEIVIILLDQAAKTSKMFIYELTKTEFILKASTPLNGTVISYGPMIPAVLSNGTVAVFVDGYMGNGAMLTEAVNYTEEGLINLFYDENDQSVSPSYRLFELPLKEEKERVLVPFARPMIKEQNDVASNEYLIDWMEYRDGEFIQSYTSYVCTAGKFEMVFEKKWEGNMIPSYLSDQKTLVFYEYKGLNVSAEEVFRIVEVPFADNSSDIADPQEYEDMVRIKTGEMSAFFVVAAEDNAFGINTEILRTNFILREG